MTHTEIDGIRLETEHIPGPADRAPLVFLHEGLGSVAMWRLRGTDWPRDLCMATGRSGWLYSRRGYGASDPVKDVRGSSGKHGAWTTGRHRPDYMHIEAHQVLPRLLQRWGVERPVLVGHSDGATIALLHACRHQVAACVAMAPHTWVENVAIQAIRAAREQYLFQPEAHKSFKNRLMRFHRDVDNAFWQWNDVWLSEPFRHFDIRAECAAISAPLLVLQGQGDEYGTLDQLTAIAAVAPQARVETIPACGHSPHRDQPAQLTGLITSFLAPLA